MCLIIDINSLASFFLTSCSDFKKYEDMRKFFNLKNGKMIIGGTKYKKELYKMNKYLGTLAELSRKNKLLFLDDVKVDKKSREIKKQLADTKFNDYHILAMAVESKVRIVLTKDCQCIAYLKTPSIYPKGQSKPGIFCGKKQKKSFYNSKKIAPCK